MATRSCAHRTAANFDAGSRHRCATSAKQIRSTASALMRRPDAVDRIEHSADGGRQTGERLLVHLVRPAEVVDDLGHRAAGDRVALVVGELQVGDLGAVLVPAAGLTQVDAYIGTNYPRSVK